MSVHLGIDIGTTKVSAALVSADLSLHFCAARDHGASLELDDGRAEQDFAKIEAAVEAAVSALPRERLAEVTSIGLSCQMHSVVLGRRGGGVSTVVTWQDRRTEDEVDGLSALCGRRLFPGYGAATLAHMARRGDLAGWDWAGSPADEFARRLTGAPRVDAMDPSLAAAWGVYDVSCGDWDFAASAALAIPERFLPRIVPSGTVVGTTAEPFAGIPAGVPVIAPIGDNQASVLGSGGDPETDLFLTVGTGSQLSAVVPADAARRIADRPGLDRRPFPGGRVLVAVPPLSGGRGLALLGEAVAGTLAAFGAPAPAGKAVLDRLDALALEAPPDAGGLRFRPDFEGSRVRPGEFGSLDGLTAGNFTLANVARALVNGIVENLFGPFPEELLSARRRLVGSGNGLARCASLRAAAEARSGLPLVLPGRREEAATGAALLGAESVRHPPKP